MNLIIKECREEILIKLGIVLNISKSSWNTVHVFRIFVLIRNYWTISKEILMEYSLMYQKLGMGSHLFLCKKITFNFIWKVVVGFKLPELSVPITTNVSQSHSWWGVFTTTLCNDILVCNFLEVFQFPPPIKHYQNTVKPDLLGQVTS